MNVSKGKARVAYTQRVVLERDRECVRARGVSHMSGRRHVTCGLRAAAAGSPPAVISQQDARAWRFPAAGAGLLLDGVVTSPPYPAAYDYLAHARRVRSLWPADPAAGDAVVPPRGSRDWPEGRPSRGP